MKRSQIIVFISVMVIGLFSTKSELQGQEEAFVTYAELQIESISNPERPEGVLYFTHPEFDNILTATVTTPAQNTEDGYIFVAAAANFYDGSSVMLILDNSGEPVYIQTVPDTLFIGDFKKQTVNGIDYLTYHTGDYRGGYTFGTSYVVDENYQIVDSWTIDNGFGADVHEFLLLDNGNAIQLAYEPVPYDLSPYGGPEDGTLIDIILQEQDASKNVVFEWVGRDHVPVWDTQIPLDTETVDYMHTNAIEVDDDGNWLLSHRHFSEITKIDRQTGNIIWRMGGENNEFTFTNDIGFSKQHDIRRIPNGNITLFDNGNDHQPAHSRAIEYIVDEVGKTVTRAWMYPGDTSEYSSAMSNFQRLGNGNSLIGWGTQPKVTEVQNDGTVAIEMDLSGLTYRAFRFDWQGAPLQAPRSVIQYGADTTAVTIYTSWNGATDISGYDIYAGPTMASLAMIGNAPRDGFETEISLTDLPPDTCFFKTKPVHAEGDPTPFSNLMFRSDMPSCWDELNHSYMPVLYK